MPMPGGAPPVSSWVHVNSGSQAQASNMVLVHSKCPPCVSNEFMAIGLNPRVWSCCGAIGSSLSHLSPELPGLPQSWPAVCTNCVARSWLCLCFYYICGFTPQHRRCHMALHDMAYGCGYGVSHGIVTMMHCTMTMLWHMVVMVMVYTCLYHVSLHDVMVVLCIQYLHMEYIYVYIYI